MLGHLQLTVKPRPRLSPGVGGPPWTEPQVPSYRYRGFVQARAVLFYADLHVHSKYSRATSRDADLEHLALWARRKGITVVGTGDFTHPAWFAEIREKLVPAEPGLFRLRPEIERAVEAQLPPACRGPVRFLLEVEISTIYKKGERTRKVHHLLYAANLETAGRMRERLGAIGNISADGRPILGLDSRHLLEITLESGSDAYLVPAHVWTPWFAALGSKSGFDSIEECYGDLAGQIFAVETGLSSDPPMNRRVSRLDRFTLVSNSDAHSPPKLGREACAFDTELDYFALRRALETGEGYLGTVEFFPEEGKYHLDGHRACGVRLEPAETRRAGGLCPVCGKPLTVGVMHRVEELADRPEEEGPPGAAGAQEMNGQVESGGPGRDRFRSLVPLPEVLAELHGVGPGSQAVGEAAARLAERLGPELDILERLPLQEVERGGGTLLGEALARLRAGRVRREAGYDGEYGVIRLFEEGEIAARRAVGGLFGAEVGRKSRVGSQGQGGRSDRGDDPLPDPEVSAGPRSGGKDAGRDARGQLSFLDSAAERPEIAPERISAPSGVPAVAARSLLDGLDPEQRAAAEITEGPLLIVAGPGTGKTRTLTHRIAHLVAAHGAAPEQCLAVTFSRRAAAELAERLAALVPEAAGRLPVATFHGLGLQLLREQAAAAGLAAGFRVALPGELAELAAGLFGVSAARAGKLCEEVGRLRRARGASLDPPDLPAETAERAALYQQALAARGLLDFDDLLLRPLDLLRRRPDLAALYRERWRWISVDEYQDVDALQYALVRLLAPADGNLCAIGDPDQSIYGFRGADVGFFLRFREDWPGARMVHLTRCYRSSRTVVEAALQAIRPTSLVPGRQLTAVRDGVGERVALSAAASERAEAELVVHAIERLVGGTSSFSFDSGRVEGWDGAGLSFGDVAVLYRTEAQAPPLVEALGRAGIPFQQRSHRPLAERPGAAALLAALGQSAGTCEQSAGTSPGQSAGTCADSVEVLLERAVSEIAGEAEGAGRTSVLAAAELLRPLALRAGADLAAFLAEAALGSEVEAWDPRAERVSLLTLHAAKGLEFPVVFLVGCEDGLLPLAWPGEESDAGTAEERRLFFVGLTRARSRLHLSWARRRTLRGEARASRPSPFLDDLAAELLDRRDEPEGERRGPFQMRLL
jgi:DNA helicase II / ATP-dependent DNA helicase PcrA